MSKLKFNLEKVKVDPLVHLRLLAHAQTTKTRNVFGQVYGALYQHAAHVTNIMPIPDTEDMQREELDQFERKFEDNLTKFKMDAQKLGWYCITYKHNFWENIEACRHYEAYIPTSFFLVLDYSVQTSNPYRAYRLKREFVEKQNFSWKDLSSFDPHKNNPFQQIPVEIAKTPICEALFQFNRESFLEGFHKSTQPTLDIDQQVKQYGEAIEEQSERLKGISELWQANKLQADKSVEMDTYCSFLSGHLTLDSYWSHFKKRQQNLQGAQHLLESLLD